MKRFLAFLTKEKYKRSDYVKLTCFFGFIISIFYIRSLAGYFQGDEWYYFTQLLPYTKVWYGPFAVLFNSVVDAQKVSGGAHYTPISFLLYYLNILFFRFNFWPYALCALIVHIANTLLVFIFIRQLFPKKTIIALLGSIFIACSYIHFQAVVWVMTYIWTGLAVTFFLLSIIYLNIYLKGLKQKYLVISALSLLCALLTKESTVVLFVLIPLVVFLERGFFLKKVIVFSYGLVAFVYFVFRFVAPPMLAKMYPPTASVTEIHKLDLGLTLFRMATYPLKMIVEVFIPDKFILPITEFITPLAYPVYGAEKTERGTNYLAFVQGAGSDMVIYVLSVVVLFILGIALYCAISKKRKESRNAIILGFAIIVFTAIPLVSIATYSPGWGYVTFIDSRHIYLASVGGAILFGMGTYALAQFLSQLSKRAVFVSVYSFLLIIVGAWLVTNFILLQKEFTFLNTMAMQRKKIIDYLQLSLPEINKEQTILIKSDTGYYGFPPIPPFQNNFGQVITSIYYDKDMLPREFMQSDFLTKNSLNGEGYVAFHNKGFGYFLQEKPLIQAVLDKKIDPKHVYAFSWEGKNNEIINYTSVFQESLRAKLKYDSQYASWKKITIAKYKLSFRIPPNHRIEKLTSQDENVEYRAGIYDQNGIQNYEILLHNKTFNKGTFEDVSEMQNSSGEIIGTDFYYRNIPLIDGEVLISKLPTNGIYMQYFMPTILPEYIVELRVLGQMSEFDKKDTIAETIISFVRYQN